MSAVLGLITGYAISKLGGMFLRDLGRIARDKYEWFAQEEDREGRV
jgi:hypothetical protein